MFERYADPAKRAIYFARAHAIHRDRTEVSPEELLVGLTWDADTRADRVARLKDRTVSLFAELSIPHLPITDIPYRTQRYLPLNREAKRVIVHAAAEADADKEYTIDTDHLLRALLREQTAVSTALETLGCSLTALRVASAEGRLKCPSRKARWYWKPPFFRSRGEFVVAVVLMTLIVLFAFGIIRALILTE